MSPVAGMPRVQDEDLRVLPARPADLIFHLTEAWLTARSGSWFPTNGAGPDEDVNVYVAGILARFTRPDSGAPSLADDAVWPLAQSPAHTLPRQLRADAYRRQGDRLLLHLGLFPAGDGLRRRAVPWGFTPERIRARDLEIMKTSYGAAAALLARTSATGLREVVAKLSRHGEDYVHVLQALAVRHLGLGARLGAAELASLVAADDDPAHATVDDVLTPRPDAATLDVVLDLVLEHRRQPTEALRRRIGNLASALGLDGELLLRSAG